MNNDNSLSVFETLIMWIISIPFHIREHFFPSQSRPKDFIPFDHPKYKDNCFYLTFPCYKYQHKRTSAVIDFWKHTSYKNQGDEFVFVDAFFGQTFISNLTIRFRPKNSRENLTINVYDSNVFFNIEITEQRIVEFKKLQTYIDGLEDLDDKSKNEYIALLNEICDNKKPSKAPLKKLFSYIMKNKEAIGFVADVTGIVGTILGFII